MIITMFLMRIVQNPLYNIINMTLMIYNGMAATRSMFMFFIFFFISLISAPSPSAWSRAVLSLLFSPNIKPELKFKIVTIIIVASYFEVSNKK